MRSRLTVVFCPTFGCQTSAALNWHLLTAANGKRHAAALFLGCLCRLAEGFSSGRTLASRLAHLFARAMLDALLFGVDVGVETGLHYQHTFPPFLKGADTA